MKFAYHTNGALHDTGSANHTFIMVINTPTVSYNKPLVWYAHFIFYSVGVKQHGSWPYCILPSSVCNNYITILQYTARLC